MKMLKAEFGYFLGAVQFLTRLPVPHLDGFAPEWLDRGIKYFPLAGVVVGSLCAGVYLLASALWSGVLPALLAVAAGVALTGAFHEDGFADFFDSMGGQSPEARLAIMKDSRLGTFGVLALGFAMAIKVAALAAIPAYAVAAALIAAHAGGRFAAIAVMPMLPYAGDPTKAKAKPLATNITFSGLAVASVFGLPPVFLLPLGAGVFACLAGFAAAAFIAWRAQALLGGFTGDVLGAVEQSFEIAFLLTAAACV
jgi:adenosylcobinamide-GDP ribazoletransferase